MVLDILKQKKHTPKEIILQKHCSQSLASISDLATRYNTFELDNINSIVFAFGDDVFLRQPEKSSPLFIFFYSLISI
jgi:hypothetical protein